MSYFYKWWMPENLHMHHLNTYAMTSIYSYNMCYNARAVWCRHISSSPCLYIERLFLTLSFPLPHPTQRHSAQLPLNTLTRLQDTSVCCKKHALAWMCEALDVARLPCPCNLVQVV